MPDLDFSIPKESTRGFELLNDIDIRITNQVFKILESSGINKSRKDYEESVSKLKGISGVDSKSLLDLIFELIRLFSIENYSEKIFVEKIVKAITLGIEEDRLNIEPDWDKLDLILNRTTTFSNTFGLYAKARSNIYKYEKVFCHSEITTDIRPIFTEDSEQKPIASIAHHLKICYHKNSNVEENDIYFALDSEDLEELKDIIDSAKKTENQIRKQFSSDLLIMNVDDTVF